MNGRFIDLYCRCWESLFVLLPLQAIGRIFFLSVSSVFISVSSVFRNFCSVILFFRTSSGFLFIQGTFSCSPGARVGLCEILLGQFEIHLLLPYETHLGSDEKLAGLSSLTLYLSFVSLQVSLTLIWAFSSTSHGCLKRFIKPFDFFYAHKGRRRGISCD